MSKGHAAPAVFAILAHRGFFPLAELDSFRQTGGSLQGTVIIADTIKGKGVSYMEGKAEWHGGAPTDEQLARAVAELGGRQ